MLYIIGVGLKPSHLTQEALEALKTCDTVYADGYTSAFAAGTWKDVSALCGKELQVLSREDIEPGKQFIQEAGEKTVAFLVGGSPYFATTHQQLIHDAEKAGVEVKVIAGVSVQDLVGKSGLSPYRFGGTTSIVFWEDNYKPESFYDAIVFNHAANLHTLCLLDIQGEKRMSVPQALSVLGEIERTREGDVLSKSTLVAMGKLGSKDEQIVAGTIEALRNADVGTPAVLLVCAPLNDKEKEFVEKWVK